MRKAAVIIPRSPTITTRFEGRHDAAGKTRGEVGESTTLLKDNFSKVVQHRKRADSISRTCSCISVRARANAGSPTSTRWSGRVSREYFYFRNWVWRLGSIANRDPTYPSAFSTPADYRRNDSYNAFFFRRRSANAFLSSP